MNFKTYWKKHNPVVRFVRWLVYYMPVEEPLILGAMISLLTFGTSLVYFGEENPIIFITILPVLVGGIVQLIKDDYEEMED